MFSYHTSLTEITKLSQQVYYQTNYRPINYSSELIAVSDDKISGLSKNDLFATYLRGLFYSCSIELEKRQVMSILSSLERKKYVDLDLLRDNQLLILSCRYGHLELAKYIIENYSELTIEEKQEGIRWAHINDNTEIIQYIRSTW